MTPWTVANQAHLSMGFSRQEYWSGLSCPPPGDLPNPGIQPLSLKYPALAGGLFTPNATWEAQRYIANLGQIPIPKKGNAKESSNYYTLALISHASKVMLKILQAKLQQYVNNELPDV